MPRKGSSSLRMSIVSMTLLAAAIAWAGNVHLKGGNNTEPTFNDGGLTLNGTAPLTGLGNGDVLVVITARANPTGECCTPGSSCKVPGQNPAPVDVTGSESIPASEVKNGNVTFSVTTNAPTTPVPGSPDCPNRSWTENIKDMSFTSATITVMHGGSTVFTLSCTFSPATSDGRVPSGNVVCS